jgi:hypothetical protein
MDGSHKRNLFPRRNRADNRRNINLVVEDSAMSEDLRKLLEECREYIAFIGAVNDPNKPDFLHRINVALAQPAAEPVAWLTKDGTESCTAGDKAMWLQQDDTKAIAAEHCIPCYAAPPSAGQIKAQALREAADYLEKQSEEHGLYDDLTIKYLRDKASEHRREGK